MVYIMFSIPFFLYTFQEVCTRLFLGTLFPQMKLFDIEPWTLTKDLNVVCDSVTQFLKVELTNISTLFFKTKKPQKNC